MDITKFCAKVEPAGRYPITAPWVKDGWRYATDARITVREPTNAPNDRLGYPDCEALFAKFRKDDIETLPLVPPLDGKVTEWAEPACALAYDPVKGCKLYGKCPATNDGECTNIIKGTTPKTQHFASYRWDGRYIELIHKELSGARYALDMGGFMHFYCGDVEGVLARLK